MEDYVLFLAGGKWQVPWISFLKEKGHAIILVDPNEDPPCKKFSDIHLKVDVKHLGAIISYLSENSCEIMFVTSDQTDVTSEPIAHLSNYYGTRSNPPEAVQHFSNKLISRKYVEQYFGDDHLPNYKKVHTSSELIDFVSKTDRKVIVKPVDSQSSRGIFLTYPKQKKGTYAKEIRKALEFSNHDFVLAEEFVEGTEITVEGLLHKGEHSILAASRKQHFRIGIASDLVYPLNIDEKLWQKIAHFHNKLIEQSALLFGLTHSEYIVNEKTGHFYLVEMACRGGGTLIPSAIVPWVSGVEVYEILYRQIIDQPLSDSQLQSLYFPYKKAATLHFFEFQPGKVMEISGVDDARNIPGVYALDLEFDPGDSIRPAADDRERQGFVIIFGNTREEVAEIKNQVYQTINVRYQKDETDILI